MRRVQRPNRRTGAARASAVRPWASRIRAPVAAVALAVTGCGGDPNRAPLPESPTFSAHVAPILYAQCAGCHRPGSAAPFPLLRYEDARDRADLIAEVTRQRQMPPWPLEPGDYPFADERRLSEREIAVLGRWAKQGAPAGDIAAAPAPPAWEGGWTLGEPDLILEMPEPYTLPAGGGEVFRNFVLPVPLDQTRYVRAVDLQPGDPMVVHHVVMAVDATAASRQEDALDPEPGFDGMFTRSGARPAAGFFVGWTPGRVPRPNPEGLAWPLEPGTDFVIQMHLRPQAHAAAVRPRVGFYFAEAPPALTPVLLRLGSQTLDIPPGQPHYAVTDSLRLPVDVELLGLYPHAHYLGKVMDVRAALPDGAVRQILRINDWDFNWQDSYTFIRPVRLPAGTVIRLRYVYDNSAANPRNPHTPPRRVVYGPNSTDEMAELWIQALPRSQSQLALLRQELARKAARDLVEGWEHLIRLNPDDAMAHASLAAFYNATGDLDRVIHHYGRAVQAQPDFAPAHYNLGIALEARGDPEGAVRHYREALRFRPDHTGAHNNLGGVLLALRQTDAAADHFRRAIELEPEHADAHNNLGRLLWGEGGTDEAIEHYRRALESRPDMAAPRFNLAVALASTGHTAEALEELQRAAPRLGPGAVEAYVEMAWLLATHHDDAVRWPEEAVVLAERAAQLHGRPHPQILDVLAAAEAAAGRFDRAASLADEAARLATVARELELATSIRGRLQLYLQRRPYIEPPR